MPTSHFHQARYLLSAHTLAQLPPDHGVEIAFAGRSNSGKSSVINALTGNRTLARISKTPGRTQQINFFALDRGSRLVDLPGYGYAKVPEAIKNHWADVLAAYLAKRNSLHGLVLIVDCRRGLQEFDMRLLELARAYDLSVHIVLNKTDKLSRQAVTRSLNAVRRLLDDHGWSGTSIQPFSALRKVGVDTLEDRLMQWLSSS